jgi:hypothetical protein
LVQKTKRGEEAVVKRYNESLIKAIEQKEKIEKA